MEVNETNAQRVSDVYSELAAITASDTEEIATAMSKTASIASSVGAEFENIAVFLAQGIETTRESADSIGTAMKTVLARFNELTKDPSEIGEVDGEVVDANKVEAALRSVGIALRDSNGQFREADKVLLEVAEKWDSMSTMQQRYIATQAAGSRQQSRFIAMMSDYNRTLELQNAAYNAEGASQAQYEKTLESLESKLAILKDTWDEFILGIANSDIIKTAVDALTKLLDVINKMSNAPGILGGVLKALLAFGAFKGGKGLFDGLMAGGQAAKAAAAEGKSASEAFWASFKKATTKAGNKKDILGDAIQANKVDFDAKGIATLRKEIDSLTSSTNQSETMLRMYEASGRDVSARSKTLATEQANLAAKQEQLNAILEKSVTVTQLTNEQKDEAVLLASLGASNDLAGIAAKNGLTAATIAECIGVEDLADATEEQINAAIISLALKKKITAETIKETIATKAQTLATKAQDLANKLQGKSFKDILPKLKDMGETVKGVMSGATSGISGITGSLSTLFTSIGSILGSIAAILGPILIAVAAIGVAFAAWKIYDKYFSLEARMNAAAEATERAEQAVDSAKSKYDDLLSGKSQYDDLQGTLDSLAEGTSEWAQALIEVNNQVIELVKSYPKLAQYLTGTEDGRLEISSEGWDSYIEEVEQAIYNTQFALSLSQLTEEKLNLESLDKTKQGNDRATTTNSGDTEYLYSHFEEKGIANFLNPTTKAFQNAVKDFGLTETELKEIAQQYTQINSEIEASNQAIKGYQTIIKKTLADSANIPEEYKEAFVEGFSEVSITDEAIEDEGKRLREGTRSDSGAAKELVERHYTSTGNQEKDLVKLMTVVSGMTEEEVIRQFASDGESITKINDTKLAKEIAKYTISNQITKKMEKAFDNFDKLTTNQRETFSALMSEDGGDLGQVEIDNINESNDVEGYLKSLSEEMGYTTTDDFAEAYNFDSFADMVSQYTNNFNNANAQITAAISGINGLLGKEDGSGIGNNLSKKLSAGTMSTLAGNFDKATIENSNSAQAATQSFLEQYNDIIKDMNSEEAEDFAQTVNSIDWNDSNAIKELPYLLKELGISVPSEELDDFVDKMLTATRATSQFNAEEIAEKVSNTVSSIQELKEVAEEDKRVVSEDLYNQIISQLPNYEDSFVKDLDGNFVLVNGTMEGLIAAMQVNTEALLKETTEGMEGENKAGEVASWLNGLYHVNNASDLKGEGDWDSDTGKGSGKKGYIGAFMTHALKNGIDINSLDIEGLSADTDVNNLSTDALNKILEGIQNYVTELENNSEELLQMKANTLTSQFQLNSGSQNAETYNSSEEGSIEKYSAERAMSAQAATYGIDSSVINQYQTNMQGNNEEAKEAANEFGKLIDTYKDAVEIWDISSSELDALTESLMTSEDGLKDNRTAAAQTAQRLINLNKGVTTICDNWEDWGKLLKKGAVDKAARGTLEYSEAMSGAREATQQMLNITEELPASFFQDAKNLELIEQAANGSNEALQSLGLAAADAMMQTYLDAANSAGTIGEVFDNSLEAAKGEWSDVLNFFKNNPLKPGDTLDSEGYIDKLNSLIQATGMTREQVTELLGSMGMDAEFNDGTTTVERQVPVTYMKRDNKYDDQGSLESYKETITTNYKTVEEEIPAPTIKTISGSYSSGGNVNYTGGDTTGGSSSGSSSSTVYESGHDKYYNTTQKISKKQDARSILQEELNELIEDEDSTLGNIQEKQEKIIKNLEEEKKLQKTLAEGRLAQIKEEQANNTDLTQYAWFDEKLGAVQINWSLINAVTDSEKGERIDEYISNLEEYADGYNEAIAAGRDIEEEIAEYREAGKNDLDDSFDILEKIEKIENNLSNLQSEREILMEDAAENSKKILESYTKEKDLLEEQLKAQKQLNIERRAQYEDLLRKATAAGAMQYITVIAEGQFNVDQTKIDQLSQTEQDFILDWLDELNEAGDAIQEATEAVNDATQAIEDFKNELEDSALDFYSTVRDLVTESYQRQIDNLQEVSDSINEANSKILDDIQETLELERQERENAETEENLADKQAQLAYLRMDTSGANQLAIKQLEEEIANDTESYTDQLIDQKISELQKQNEKAFEQRQVQIDLMQKQLEYNEETGKINQEVSRLIGTGVDNTGKIISGSDLESLFANSEMFKGLTESEIAKEMTAYEQNVIKYLEYLTGYRQIGMESSGYSIDDEVTDKMGLTNTGATATVVGEGQIKITTKDGHEYIMAGVTSGLDGDINTSTANYKIQDEAGNLYTAGKARLAMRYATRIASGEEIKQVEDNIWLYDMNKDGKVTIADARLLLRTAAGLENIWDISDYNNLKNTIDSGKYDATYDFNDDKKLDKDDLSLFLNNYFGGKKFKTGGLADFTGPAWLDGTKSKPEMVLNARDTENFIQLKDILSQVLKGVDSAKTDEKIGDMYYEIHIDVEKLTNDYDVDDVAKRVQQIITQDANYRNVNLINRLR